jgi:MoxR-like ATPase
MTSVTEQAEQLSWRLFEGNNQVHALDNMPPAPPWRQPRADEAAARKYDEVREPLSAATAKRGSAYQATPEIVQMVNAALHLRRPLLVTGAPGTGKSSLIDAVAYELGLGEPSRWPVNSRSTLREALYNYDAIGRAQHRTDQTPLKDEDYIELGPLGTALVPAIKPRPLLIDEMDKADVDLANDLLHVLEEGYFHIRELSRMARSDDDSTHHIRMFGSTNKVEVAKGKVERYEFPFLIITSNGERSFPPAFLRRCLQIKMPDPGRDVERLTRIVRAHLNDPIATDAKPLIERFAAKAAGGENVATDQLLNAIQLVFGGYGMTEPERQAMIERLTSSLTGPAQ